MPVDSLNSVDTLLSSSVLSRRLLPKSCGMSLALSSQETVLTFSRNTEAS